MVGKYVELTESYKSLTEAIKHGGFANDCAIKIVYVDSEEVEKTSAEETIKNATAGETIDAILIPGGFGSRGSEGKIAAVKYARENNVPFLGICLGLQMAVIEYARDIANIQGATSEEFDEKAKHQVIHIMEHQKSVQTKGATMRLGSYPCAIKSGTLANKIYGKGNVSERHRHRFEVNNTYRAQLERSGLICSGLSPDGNLVEIIELKDHPFFIGVQFHPEFKSTPQKPHPLFKSFVTAALSHRDARLNPDKAKGGNGSGTPKKDKKVGENKTSGNKNNMEQQELLSPTTAS